MRSFHSHRKLSANKSSILRGSGIGVFNIVQNCSHFDKLLWGLPQKTAKAIKLNQTRKRSTLAESQSTFADGPDEGKYCTTNIGNSNWSNNQNNLGGSLRIRPKFSTHTRGFSQKDAEKFISSFEIFANVACGVEDTRNRVETKKGVLFAAKQLENMIRSKADSTNKASSKNSREILKTLKSPKNEIHSVLGSIFNKASLTSIAQAECPVSRLPKKQKNITPEQLALQRTESMGNRIIFATKRLRKHLELAETLTCRSCSKSSRCSYFKKPVPDENAVSVLDVAKILIGYNEYCKSFVAARGFCDEVEMRDRFISLKYTTGDVKEIIEKQRTLYPPLCGDLDAVHDVLESLKQALINEKTLRDKNSTSISNGHENARPSSNNNAKNNTLDSTAMNETNEEETQNVFSEKSKTDNDIEPLFAKDIPTADKATSKRILREIRTEKMEKIIKKREKELLNLPDWLQEKLKPTITPGLTKRQRFAVKQRLKAESAAREELESDGFDIVPGSTKEGDIARGQNSSTTASNENSNTSAVPDIDSIPLPRRFEKFADGKSEKANSHRYSAIFGNVLNNSDHIKNSSPKTWQENSTSSFGNKDVEIDLDAYYENAMRKRAKQNNSTSRNSDTYDSQKGNSTMTTMVKGGYTHDDNLESGSARVAEIVKSVEENETNREEATNILTNSLPEKTLQSVPNISPQAVRGVQKFVDDYYGTTSTARGKNLDAQNLIAEIENNTNLDGSSAGEKKSRTLIDDKSVHLKWLKRIPFDSPDEVRSGGVLPPKNNSVGSKSNKKVIKKSKKPESHSASRSTTLRNKYEKEVPSLNLGPNPFRDGSKSRATSNNDEKNSISQQKINRQEQIVQEANLAARGSTSTSASPSSTNIFGSTSADIEQDFVKNSSNRNKRNSSDRKKKQQSSLFPVLPDVELEHSRTAMSDYSGGKRRKKSSLSLLKQAPIDASEFSGLMQNSNKIDQANTASSAGGLPEKRTSRNSESRTDMQRMLDKYLQQPGNGGNKRRQLDRKTRSARM